MGQFPFGPVVGTVVNSGDRGTQQEASMARTGSADGGQCLTYAEVGQRFEDSPGAARQLATRPTGSGVPRTGPGRHLATELS
jgi:hypothetical protein